MAGGLWGTVLLSNAQRLAGPTPVAVVRVLGARYLVQAVLLTRTDRPPVRAAYAVDVTHALSMLAFLPARRYRRRALISAGVAVALAILAGPGSPPETACRPHADAVRF